METPAARGYGIWAVFCNFVKKKGILMSLDHILHVFRAIWKDKFFNIW